MPEDNLFHLTKGNLLLLFVECLVLAGWILNCSSNYQKNIHMHPQTDLRCERCRKLRAAYGRVNKDEHKD